MLKYEVLRTRYYITAGGDWRLGEVQEGSCSKITRCISGCRGCRWRSVDKGIDLAEERLGGVLK